MSVVVSMYAGYANVRLYVDSANILYTPTGSNYDKYVVLQVYL